MNLKAKSGIGIQDPEPESGSRFGIRDQDLGSGSRIRIGIQDKVWIQDSDPGQGLDPRLGSRIGIQDQDPGSGIMLQDPDPVFRIGIKSGIAIQDRNPGLESKIGIRDQDIGSGSRIGIRHNYFCNAFISRLKAFNDELVKKNICKN